MQRALARAIPHTSIHLPTRIYTVPSRIHLAPPRSSFTPPRAMSMSHASSSSGPRPSPSLRDLSPPVHLGMKDLDRSAFTLCVPVLAARVSAAKIAAVRRHELLYGHIVDIGKIKSILPDGDGAYRRLLLRVPRETDLPNETRDYLASEGATFVPEVIELDYNYWPATAILNAIIPANDDDVPSSFTQTGHIAHLNLRDEWLPYKHIIGQVIMDKIPAIRTVVNKLNSIHAQFRYFDMEVIAGEPDYITTASESGCTFTFDFSRVYWNSRLHTEHDRLITLFEPGQVVADAMAGVGPFAIPASKRGAYVFGNDLNPESVKWMRENRIRNKVEERLRVTECDAREFIRTAPTVAWKHPFPRSQPGSTRQKEKEARRARAAAAASTPTPTPSSNVAKFPAAPSAAPVPPAPQTIDHFVMNLPDSALEFLDAYAGSYTPLLGQEGFDAEAVSMPLIHVHCFTRELEPEAALKDINERASTTLGHTVHAEMDGYLLHPVRRVAPNKDMYCLTFRLPRQVAFKQ